MNLASLELEERLESLLTEAAIARARESGQLDGLGDAELAGIFSKIKKGVKKVASAVGKVVRKVAPIAVGAAALYFGGPIVAKAVGGVAKKVLGKTVSAPAASVTAVTEAVATGALAAQPPAQSPPPSSPTFLQTAATLANTYLQAKQSTAALAASQGMQPIMQDVLYAQAQQPNPYAVVPAPGQYAGQIEASTGDIGMPKWLLPVGAGVGFLMLMMMMTQRR